MLRSFALLAILAAQAFAAPVPKEQSRSDEKMILGLWEVTAFSRDGAEIARGKNTLIWRFEADAKAAQMNPTDTAATFKLLPNKGFDWKTEGYDYRGLYELRGDVLKIVISTDDDLTRPKRLEPGANINYYEFKRVKPEDKK